jgi:glycosyltransferase involved in cell wall biosynthesis
MKKASFVVVPSECFENFPRVIVEAMACGTPVIASAHGAMSELIREGITGMLFEPFNAQALREKMVQGYSHPDIMRAMSLNARQEYENKYTSSINCRLLHDIYQRAVGKD